MLALSWETLYNLKAGCQRCLLSFAGPTQLEGREGWRPKLFSAFSDPKQLEGWVPKLFRDFHSSCFASIQVVLLPFSGLIFADIEVHTVITSSCHALSVPGRYKAQYTSSSVSSKCTLCTILLPSACDKLRSLSHSSPELFP